MNSNQWEDILTGLGDAEGKAAFYLFDELRKDFTIIFGNSIIGVLENRGLGIQVDGHDLSGFLDTGYMLDRS